MFSSVHWKGPFVDSYVHTKSSKPPGRKPRRGSQQKVIKICVRAVPRIYATVLLDLSSVVYKRSQAHPV